MDSIKEGKRKNALDHVVLGRVQVEPNLVLVLPVLLLLPLPLPLFIEV